MVSDVTWLRWIVALPALGVLFHVFVGQRTPGAVKVVGPGVVGAAFVIAVTAVLRLHGLEEGGALRDHRLHLDRRRALPRRGVVPLRRALGA